MATPTQAIGAIRTVAAEQVKNCDFRAAGILDASRLAPLTAANEAFIKALAAAFNTRFGVPCDGMVQSLDVAVVEAFVGGKPASSTYFISLIMGSHAETG